MERITATQYAEYVGKSPSHITKKLSAMQDKKLPGARSVEKFGNTWVITLRAGINKDQLKKLFENN